jgi:hypothetical protein
MNPHYSDNDFAIKAGERVVISKNIFEVALYNSHTVQQKETLSGMSLDKIKALNPQIRNFDLIQIGQQIRIKKRDNSNPLQLKHVKVYLEKGLKNNAATSTKSNGSVRNDGRCGKDFGNAPCPPGQTCSQWGWCQANH